MLSLLANGLKIVQGDVKVETISEGFSLELHGKFIMKRGDFQQTCAWYGRMYETSYGNNLIGVDDWELQETTEIKLGELPIDDVHEFKNSLSTIGLRTLANSIGFSSDEEDKAIFQAIMDHKDFKKAFGKKAILWNALPENEQKLVVLKYVCENYTTCGQHRIKEVGKYYGIDTEVDPNDANNYITIIPSLEVCQAKLDELTK